MEVTNTLAYYDTATITAVKSFRVQAPWAETKWEIRLFDQKNSKKFKSVYSCFKWLASRSSPVDTALQSIWNYPKARVQQCSLVLIQLLSIEPRCLSLSPQSNICNQGVELLVFLRMDSLLPNIRQVWEILIDISLGNCYIEFVTFRHRLWPKLSKFMKFKISQKFSINLSLYFGWKRNWWKWNTLIEVTFYFTKWNIIEH
jgi:hypothetical protein